MGIEMYAEFNMVLLDVIKCFGVMGIRS